MPKSPTREQRGQISLAAPRRSPLPRTGLPRRDLARGRALACGGGFSRSLSRRPVRLARGGRLPRARPRGAALLAGGRPFARGNPAVRRRTAGARARAELPPVGLG